MSFNTQLDNAKFSLIVDYKSVFISTILFNLHILEDSTISTACTNGKYIKINPTFFGSLSLKERVFLLAHEAWHVCFNHMSRLEDRCPDKWNQAADHVINLMLIDAGYTFIKCGLADSQYAGMSTEEVYDLLPKNDGKPNPMGNDIEPATGDAAEELTQEITDLVIQATTQADMQNQGGTVPSSISRMVQDILYPELPYGVLLDKYFNDRAQEDYSWSKRNRRYADVYLPSLYSERMGTIAIYVDASCSVSEEQFSEYIALLIATKEHYNPKKMIIADFDTEIKEVRELTDCESARDIEFTGGGGTRIRPTMDHIHTNDADVNIIITDGYFRASIPDGFNKEVIWLIDNNKNFASSTGTIININ